jgi:hypothetical protein
MRRITGWSRRTHNGRAPRGAQVIVRFAAPCRCVPLTANVMTQFAESIGWFALARTPRPLLALWRANQRHRPGQAPRTAVGFGAASDRQSSEALRPVGTLGSAVGSKALAAQRPSLAVACNHSASSKRRCDRRGVLAASLHCVPLARRGITGRSIGRPSAAAELRR